MTDKNDTVMETDRDTMVIPIPKVAPFGWKMTSVDLVQEVWDTFVKPDQEKNIPQSGEMRMLMAVLRAVGAGFVTLQEELQAEATSKKEQS